MTSRTGNQRGVRGRILVLATLPLLLISARARADAQGETPAPLQARLDIGKGPYLVGQGVVVTVRVIGEAERPRIVPPRVSGADIWPIDTDVKPLAVSGIGETVSQDNLFLSRFRLVPRRAGKIEIPSLRIEVGGREGRTRPTTFEVQAPPIAGRPGSFLGGIGSLEIRAEADPTALRVGQTLEYRIHLDGPAAWGSTVPPDLARFDRLPLGLRVEPLRDDLIQEPPSRTLTYRIRPTRPGEAALPAILISTYDPKLVRYLTKTTPSMPLKVVAVPAFDPKSIDYRPPAPHRSSTPWLIGGGATLVMVIAAWWWLRRRRSRSRRPRPDAARRFATRTASEFEAVSPDLDQAEFARRVTEALIRYLELGSGRAPGALTPPEAGRGVAELAGSADLGERAERLLAACDRILYGSAREAPLAADDARQFFRDLGSR